MKPFRPGRIDGVIYKPLEKLRDARGWLCELVRDDDLPTGFHPVMTYLSETLPGIARGPHEHRHQTDCFFFLGPSMFKIEMWDNRPHSPTYWCHETNLVGELNPMMVLVPPGIVHAYRNVGRVPGLIVNAPNRLYRGIGKQDPVDEVRHEADPASPFHLDEGSCTLRLRCYQPADQAACLAILHSNRERYFSPGDEEEFLRFIANPPGFYGVLEREDGTIVGCGGVAVRGAEAVLTWGMVHADSHGKGLGRFLLVERLRLLLGQTNVQSVCINTSQATLGFYRRMGFVVVGQSVDGSRPGLDRYDLQLAWEDEVKRNFLSEPEA